MPDTQAQKMPDGTLVIDSRLIAYELDINHSDWIQNTIKKYQSKVESAFGSLRFENGVKKREIGATVEKFVWLTEEQSLFYLTLSRNTEEVVRTKAKLIQEFSNLKKILSQQGYREVTTSVYINRLERKRDHLIDDDRWCIFTESSDVLLLVEKVFRIPVQQMDLCDGSIGSRWMPYREGKNWKGTVKPYTHRFPDGREVFANSFELKELPYFRKWLRDEYETKLLSEYLITKYGKRAVLQVYQEQGLVNEHILKLTEEKKKTKRQEEVYQAFLAMREVINNRNKQLKGYE